MTEDVRQDVGTTCYRHPDRETGLSCSNCGRPICAECMTATPVGQRCPECVGRQQVRRPRTMSRVTPYVTYVLIGINVAMFLWVVSVADGAIGSIPTRYLYDAGAIYGPAISDGDWWRVVSGMFLHASILHIAFNMFALWILGPQLEMVLGRLRFAALYLLSGLIGSAAVYLLAPPESSSLGASGAIFGLMAALLVFAYKMRADVSQLMVWIGINAALTFFAAGISWQAHVGGFVGGLVLAGILAYAPRRHRAAWQAAGFAGVAILVALAFAMRTVALT